MYSVYSRIEGWLLCWYFVCSMTCGALHTCFQVIALLLPVDFAHHGLDIDRSGGSGSLGLFLRLLLPEDDGMDAWASVLSVLLQLGRTRETET